MAAGNRTRTGVAGSVTGFADSSNRVLDHTGANSPRSPSQSMACALAA